MTTRIIFSGLCIYILTAANCEYIAQNSEDAPTPTSASVISGDESQTCKEAPSTDQSTLDCADTNPDELSMVQSVSQ